MIEKISHLYGAVVQSAADKRLKIVTVRVRVPLALPIRSDRMDNEIKHTIEFGEKTLSILKALTEALRENNELNKNGNPGEFAKEVCANIYANILIESLFPEGYNRLL